MPPEKDDKPDDTDKGSKKPAVTFDTNDDFMHAVGERADKKVKAALKDARKAFLAELGLESDDDVAELKAIRENASKSKTESETLAAQLKKLTKELSDARKEAEEGKAFKVKTTKDAALRKFAGKVRDYDDLVAHLENKVPFTDEGAVDDKALEKLVDGLLTAKPHLAKPDYKPGSGTSHRETTSGKAPNGEGKSMSPVDKFTAALVEEHRKAQSQ